MRAATPHTRSYSSMHNYFNADILKPNTVYIMPHLKRLENLYGTSMKFVPLEGYEEYDNIHLVWSDKSSNPMVQLYIDEVKKLNQEMK